MAAMREKLAQNLAEVRERIATAARSAGRTEESVRLVAVTKQVGADLARELGALGVTDFGESRPQELWRKREQLPGRFRWHLVGPLQRNKTRRTLPLVDLTHSVDSTALLKQMHRVALELDLKPAVLLEVNVSGEAAKHGFGPEELERVVSDAGMLHRVHICGLMTMAPYDSDPERARPTFAALRKLRDRVLSLAAPHCHLTELSMGMSGDFEVAIAEGATIVRIGSALFQGIEQSPGAEE